MSKYYEHLLIGLRVKVTEAHPYLGINRKGRVGYIESITDDGQVLIRFRGLGKRKLGFTSLEIERAG